eukprot:9967744-Lingulodinium_polyedra.AAC.1
MGAQVGMEVLSIQALDPHIPMVATLGGSAFPLEKGSNEAAPPCHWLLQPQSSLEPYGEHELRQQQW